MFPFHSVEKKKIRSCIFLLTLSTSQYALFSVFWDPDIVNNIKEHPPMDYSSREPMTNNNVTIHDIKKFFVQYAVSNNLGVIAHAHLALSDQLEEGPFHGKCLRLAQLHSDAVDFPKSGKPAEMNPELRPKKYPDFMEKSPDRTYKSKRVLGRIYRECGKHEAFTPKNDDESSLFKDLLIEGYQDYLANARECKTQYDAEVKSLMNQYGVRRYVCYNVYTVLAALFKKCSQIFLLFGWLY